MTRKSELQLDKAPIVIEQKEAPKERLAKLRKFLKEETTVHGNSLYAQDLQLSIKQMNERNW
jgi:hypothetical protein